MNKVILVFFLFSASLFYSSCKLFKPFYEKKQNNIIRDSSQVVKPREYKKIQKQATDTFAKVVDTITYIKAKIITINKDNDTTIRLVTQNENLPNEYFYKLLIQNNIKYENATLKCKVSFDNGEHNQNFNSNFRIRNDSITWCSISAVIGEVARAIVNSDSIKAIDKLGNKALMYSYQDLSSLIQLNLPHNQLQDLILGNTLFQPAVDRITNISNDAYGTFKIKAISPLGEFTYSFNADTTINAILLNTTVNEKPYVVNIYYSDYIPYEQYKISTKRHYIIQQAEKITDVQIDVQKFSTNLPNLDYPFTIPKHFKRIFKKKGN